MITDLADTGTTFFLSTHILPVVEEIADTVGILYDGELVAEGSPADLERRAETGETRSLEDAFLELTTDDFGGAGESDGEVSAADTTNQSVVEENTDG